MMKDRIILDCLHAMWSIVLLGRRCHVGLHALQTNPKQNFLLTWRSNRLCLHICHALCLDQVAVDIIRPAVTFKLLSAATCFVLRSFQCQKYEGISYWQVDLCQHMEGLTETLERLLRSTWPSELEQKCIIKNRNIISGLLCHLQSVKDIEEREEGAVTNFVLINDLMERLRANVRSLHACTSFYVSYAYARVSPPATFS